MCALFLELGVKACFDLLPVVGIHGQNILKDREEEVGLCLGPVRCTGWLSHRDGMKLKLMGERYRQMMGEVWFMFRLCCFMFFYKDVGEALYEKT